MRARETVSLAKLLILQPSSGEKESLRKNIMWQAIDLQLPLFL